MKRSLSFWQFAGFVFTSIGGTLLHFLYEWSGKSAWAAPFSGVNESTWEHMKLLFFPLLVYALFERVILGKQYPSFWCVKLRGTVVGLVLIPLIYYTYTGALGVSVDALNISLFFIAAAVTFWYETRLLQRERVRCRAPRAALLMLLVLAAVFVMLTYFPPHLPLFADPLTGTYGVG